MVVFCGVIILEVFLFLVRVVKCTGYKNMDVVDRKITDNVVLRDIY